MNNNEDDKLSEVSSTLGINLFQLKEKYKNIIEKNDNSSINEISPASSSSSTTISALSIKDLSTSYSNEFSSKPIVVNNNQSNDVNMTDKQKESIETQKVLDHYKICKTCLGQGYTTYIYNHRKMEQTCEECDGDSIVISQAYKEIENHVNSNI